MNACTSARCVSLRSSTLSAAASEVSHVSGAIPEMSSGTSPVASRTESPSPAWARASRSGLDLQHHLAVRGFERRFHAALAPDRST